MKEILSLLLSKPPASPHWEQFKNEKGLKPSQLEPTKKPMPLSQEFIRFSSQRVDQWTLSDAVRGLIVTGGIGAGKSSGSGKKIGSSFLKKGMGGLVLCVKTDEALEWEELITQVGRKKDLIRIQAGSPYGFNFLDWEQKRSEAGGGGLVTNITNFFMDVISVIDKSQSAKEDGFWDRSLRQLLNHSIVLASGLSDTLTIPNLLTVIQNAPQTLKSTEGLHSDYLSPTAEHPFDRICQQARARCKEGQRLNLEKSIEYFTQQFASLAEKTRSIVLTSFTSMADPLLREPLYSLFCDDTKIQPEDCFDGKIIVVDIPVHSFQFVGRIANLIWKTAFKRACQSRVRPETPVFFWMDECQYLVDPSDGAFQTTARSSLCCSVFLTQTISNLTAEFGSQSKVDALLACFQTKIFHQNGDYETNAWATKTIQKLPVTLTSESKPKNSLFSWNKSHTVTQSTQWQEDVPGRVFLTLKSGGIENQYRVEGIVFVPGRKFSSSKPWIRAVFDQKQMKG